MGFVADLFGFGDDPGEAAANASIAASQTQAQYQRDALNYLKETEALPQSLREGALTKIGGVYDVPGGEGSQQDMIDAAISSPLYGAIMGGQEAGEESILRNASATGGLRSGNVQGNLYDYNVQLQNKALLESYNQQMQGLQGLAGLPSNATQIANQTSSIGQTLGQGQVAAGQAIQAGNQQEADNWMGLGGLGLAAYGMFSDRRLKKNIKKVGFLKGFNIYSWDWNIVAQKMGLTGGTIGCMADEVYTERPDAVSIKDLFMFVHYDRLGIIGV